MHRRPYRRPVWQPKKLARLRAFLRETVRRITFKGLVIAVFAVPLLFYVYREGTRDVLIIDPFSVPKRFEEVGLTSEVLANRVGDALRQLEVAAQSGLKKDSLAALHDEGSSPDVEIPGTNLGLKTAVEITRSIFGIYPKHIGGDIVISANALANTGTPTAKEQATVTVYLTQGRNRNAPFSALADDAGTLVKRAAEIALGQANPYELAAYRYRNGDYDDAVKIVGTMIQSPSADRLHKSAALNLWGIVLEDEKNYTEAIAKYQKSTELDPKSAVAYSNWGKTLWEQNKYDEAVAKYQKAIEVDPKYAIAYNNWGRVLNDQKNYDEAIVKEQKALELEPTFSRPYTNWGNALRAQKKYDGAIAKYKKAIELAPKDALPYNNWGILLYDQKNYDEAIAKYQKAIELDPQNTDAYSGWGNALRAQGKNGEAAEKLNRAAALSRHQ
jgi:tetratricopeptide (TPR) repeat protein